jgi:Uma2 family endonuclease
MASSVAVVSVEDYLRLNAKPACEYWDGEVTQKAMGTKLHSYLQFALLAALKQQGKQPYPELAVRVSPTRFLIPDVAVAEAFEGPYPTEPVLLCCEVLSPEDRLGAMLAKCEEYHAWGVPYCWVVDPVKRSAWQYHKGEEPVHLSAEGALSAGEIRVALFDLFANMPSA